MGDKKILSVDQILQCSDLEEKTIDIPAWDGSVKIRGFSKAKQQQMRKEAMKAGEIDTERLEMLMFIYGVVDPEFTKDHYEQLRDKSSGVIDYVLTEIMNLSGVSEEAVKQAEKLFRTE